jgi:hypothetical protein
MKLKIMKATTFIVLMIIGVFLTVSICDAGIMMIVG